MANVSNKRTIVYQGIFSDHSLSIITSVCEQVYSMASLNYTMQESLGIYASKFHDAFCRIWLSKVSAKGFKGFRMIGIFESNAGSIASFDFFQALQSVEEWTRWL